MLCKHGLLGEYRFAGKEGILSFVRQAGCIQYDPVDVCGRNADLVLQSRIKGYRKPMLTMCCRCCLASGLSAESKWLMTGKRKGWM